MLSDFKSQIATTQWHRLAIGCFFCLVAIGLGTGFGILSTRAKNESQDDYDHRLAVFTDWQMKVTTTFTRASTLASSAATFAKSSVTTPANLSASVIDRVKEINPPAFDEIFADLFAEVPGISSVQLQSGGVISQMWPPNSTTRHFDVLNSPGFNAVYGALMDEGKPLTAGPVPMTGVRAGYGIFVRYPVFVGAIKNRSTFWGVGTVLIKVHELMEGLQIENLLYREGMDYALWFETNNTKTIIAQTGVSYTTAIPTHTPASDVGKVMNHGLRMQLPVSEPGKVSYLAIYPRNGPVSDQIKGNDIAVVTVVSIVGSGLLVVILYLVLLCHFKHQHRHAPPPGETVLAAILTLRGAQSVVEKAPAESARMFSDFLKEVHARAERFGCYVICDVGDRSVYVTARHPRNLLRLSQDVVTNVSISGTIEVEQSQGRPHNPHLSNQSMGYSPLLAPNGSRAGEEMNRSPTIFRSVQQNSMQSNSFNVASRLQQIGSEDGSGANNNSSSLATVILQTVICQPSVVLTVLPENSKRVFDGRNNVYFYSNAPQLSKIGGKLDQTKAGEIAWCGAFGKACEECSDDTEALKSVCDDVYPPDASLEEETCGIRVIRDETKSNAVVLNIICLKEQLPSTTENSDDPSMALIFLNDPYICAMTDKLHVAKHDLYAARRHVNKKKLNNKNNNTSEPNSINAPKSAINIKESTHLSRSSTLLYIHLYHDPRISLDTIRRIVSEERGTVISASGQTIITAFNLISPSGRHQLKAADTVARLRVALLESPFVCAISDGRFEALVSDGLVMCTGEVVSTCEHLLALSLNIIREKRLKESEALASNLPLPNKALFMKPPPRLHGLTDGDSDDEIILANSGMCLLLCQTEVASSYDCEAIDVYTPPGHKTRIIYQLQARKGTAVASAEVGFSKSENANYKEEDEWMYCLRDDDTKFGPVNAIFIKIRNGELDDARRMWRQLLEAEASLKAAGETSCGLGISKLSRESLHRILSE